MKKDWYEDKFNSFWERQLSNSKQTALQFAVKV